ncbi:hypothetical protein L6654_42400 [Bradyrhizobium sp. WYCCWR 13023]|uniref:Uncharacterized protein n=1 Tax=Bradyrhizobium zhengyangense TaxID=2911009 RepID=A0A9X1RM59_9BRAD|nr:hypothetical protein [Bradyrhizobium zhengyangense]MCG2633174.1 hypothetical protein [Bradyrhizobium zhengyangense]
MFWAPEVLAAVVPIKVAVADEGGASFQPLLDLTSGKVRRAAGCWRAVLRIGATDHRVWSKEPPVFGASYAGELLLMAISAYVRMQPDGCGAR